MREYERLEQEFAKWSNLDPAGMVACSSGTAALHLALESLSLPLGSKVIVPSYSMIACARAVTMAGLEPVFLDVKDDLLLDPELIPVACKKTSNVSAVMPVHIYGRKCDMEKICQYADEYGISVIEDRAEYHVPLYSGEERGEVLCWSFYSNKVIGGEEGGAVWFDEDYPRKVARGKRCLGFTSDHDYTHSPRGYNYRLADCLATKVLSSLKEVVTSVENRVRVAAMYDHFCPNHWRMPHRRSPWVYDLRIPNMCKEQQDNIIKELKKFGLHGARHGFKALHRQEEYEVHPIFDYGCKHNESTKSSTEVILLPLTTNINLGTASKCFDIISNGVGHIQERFIPLGYSHAV